MHELQIDFVAARLKKIVTQAQSLIRCTSQANGIKGLAILTPTDMTYKSMIVVGYDLTTNLIRKGTISVL
tara:strand:- start:1600 stop:1809 length:210 start_codon:yes stop_codon:yes gene_type:complete